MNKETPTLQARVESLRAEHSHRLSQLHHRRSNLQEELAEVEREIHAQGGAAVAFDKILAEIAADDRRKDSKAAQTT